MTTTDQVDQDRELRKMNHLLGAAFAALAKAFVNFDLCERDAKVDVFARDDESMAGRGDTDCANPCRAPVKVVRTEHAGPLPA